MENDILCVRKEGGSVILPVFFSSSASVLSLRTSSPPVWAFYSYWKQQRLEDEA